jgi:agmatinase
MDFSLLGICLDRKEFRRGSHRAPQEIKKILPQLETHIDGIDLQEVWLKDLGCLEPRNYDEITDYVKNNMKYGFPIILGGDHSITYPAVKSLKPKVFVVFDAHPDCEDKDLCFSSVTHKIAEDGFKTYIYGTRCFSKAESDYIKNGKVKIATLEDLKAINEPTYLSIDFDVLDSAIMPSVAVPEPGGLNFNQVIEAIRAVAKNLVAVDFVEFLPTENITYTLIAGKLIYSTLAEILKAKSSERR